MKAIEKVKIARKKYTITRDGVITHIWSGHVIKPFHNKLGYAFIRLNLGNKIEKNLSVHQFLAYEFLPKPKKCTEINHIDGNPSNNNLDNLEWCTPRQNVRARFKRDPREWKRRDRMQKQYHHEYSKQYYLKQQLL